MGLQACWARKELRCGERALWRQGNTEPAAGGRRELAAKVLRAVSQGHLDQKEARQRHSGALATGAGLRERRGRQELVMRATC